MLLTTGEYVAMRLPNSVNSLLRRPNPLILLITFAVFLNIVTFAIAGDKGYVKPSAKNKCPVCGMFVAKHPEWIAEIQFKDGTYNVFDGAKDMFFFLARMSQYDHTHTLSDIISIYVMDYYSVLPVDGYKAFYVMGSDVYGPMGVEFIPFEKETDAMEFMKDHGGQRICRYRDITPKFLEDYD